NPDATDDEASEKPPAVSSVAVHLSAGTLVIRLLSCGLLVCGLSSPPAESETPAHAGTPTGSQRGARPNYQAQHFLAPGSPLEGVASSAVSDAGSVGTVGRRVGRELAVLRKRVEEVGRWLDEELGGHGVARVYNHSSLPHVKLCLAQQTSCVATRRNMILRDDNTISLVDWDCAGLYPRLYETTTLPCLSPWDAQYQKPLIEATDTLLKLTDEEKRLARLVQIARAASLRYSFDTDTKSYGLPEGFSSLPPLPLLG
ncbi:hypothetical protein V492_04253, partial [Pseudogymnoascus sp. VKM F-4246]